MERSLVLLAGVGFGFCVGVNVTLAVCGWRDRKRAERKLAAYAPTVDIDTTPIV